MMPIDHTLVDTRIGTGFGITALPHLQDLAIAGPMKVTGVSDTPSRQRVFACRPTAADEERACATDTVRRLATQAFRGPVSAADMADLMKFYDQGRKDGDFESGIRMAVQGILANPRFLFRVEQHAGDAPGRRSLPRRRPRPGLAAVVLPLGHGARRRAAEGGHAPARSRPPAGAREAGARACWPTRRPRRWPPASARSGCACRTSTRCGPTASSIPQWDHVARRARCARETELFFDSLVREDRSVLDLLTADYTFVNERLARHYGIPNVTGPTFRRVHAARRRAAASSATAACCC